MYLHWLIQETYLPNRAVTSNVYNVGSRYWLALTSLYLAVSYNSTKYKLVIIIIIAVDVEHTLSLLSGDWLPHSVEYAGIIFHHSFLSFKMIEFWICKSIILTDNNELEHLLLLNTQPGKFS